MLYAGYKHAGFMSETVSVWHISHYEMHETIYRGNILPLINSNFFNHIANYLGGKRSIV